MQLCDKFFEIYLINQAKIYRNLIHEIVLPQIVDPTKCWTQKNIDYSPRLNHLNIKIYPEPAYILQGIIIQDQ